MSILMLSYSLFPGHPRSVFSLGFMIEILFCIITSHISQAPWFDHSNDTWSRVQSLFQPYALLRESDLRIFSIGQYCVSFTVHVRNRIFMPCSSVCSQKLTHVSFVHQLHKISTPQAFLPERNHVYVLQFLCISLLLLGDRKYVP